VKILKPLKKFYFENILGYRPLTVILRHSINPEQEKYLKNHSNFLDTSNCKKWFQKYSREDKFLEIGFGGGEHLVKLAQENRENRNLKILGVELYKPGVVKVLKKIDEERLDNLFVSADDARDILKSIPRKSLKRLCVLFPDPWTKKRQFSRRLLNLKFLKQTFKKLTFDGQMIIATDWVEYAVEIEKDLGKLKEKIEYKKFVGNDLENDERFQNICTTNFAKRAQREGRVITIFIFKKKIKSRLFLLKLVPSFFRRF
jgi:tRNA (guanine-N7-)-methyltransferase